jgi:RNA polymerase sigma factor (sigma-70 family)
MVAPGGGDDRALVAAALHGGERERDEFVRCYLPQIAGVARDYRGVRSVCREELMQAGVLGLLRALERYELERENSFWTYARWWVRQAMQELVSSLNNAVVFSDRALRQLARVNHARREHMQSRGCEPSTSDLAAITGLKPTQVTTLIGAAQPSQALDERADADRTRSRAFVESLPDPAGEDGFEHATLRVTSRALPLAFATLSPRECAIVRGRYGFDGRPRSIRELAAELCVSPERARQIEQAAMRKLRESCDPTGAAA